MAEPELSRYCEYFIRVMKAGFGQDKQITATIFSESKGALLPYRLVAFELNQSSKNMVCIEPMASPALLSELEKINQRWLLNEGITSGGIYQKRIARIYDYRNNAPTIYIIKPDARRYWTRSAGLSDADDVAADFARWQAATRSGDQDKCKRGGLTNIAE
jgi:hypothetical protein